MFMDAFITFPIVSFHQALRSQKAALKGVYIKCIKSYILKRYSAIENYKRLFSDVKRKIETAINK